MPMKRVVLQPTQDEDAYNITVDLVLTDTGMATRRMVAFGVLGSLGENPEVAAPFLLRPDGSMDFGTGEYDDNADRDGRIERMDQRAFTVGELFTISYEGEEYIYRVAQLLDHQ
jgi:hypothetical protein